MNNDKPVTGNNRDYYKTDGKELTIEYTDCHGNKRLKKEILVTNKTGINPDNSSNSFYKVVNH